MKERNIVSISTTKKLKLGFMSVRELSLTLIGVKEVETIRTDQGIVELIFDGQHSIKVGDHIDYYVETKSGSERIMPYTINYITKTGENYFLVEELENLSTRIALPSICSGSKYPTGESILHHLRTNSIEDFDLYWVINAYVGKDGEEIGKYIYLKSKYHVHDRYEALENKLVANPNFISHEDIEGYVTYKFKIPEKYKQDIKYFAKGKFSKMSPEYLKKVVAFNSWEPATVLRGALLREDWYIKILMDDLALDFEPTELLSKPKLIEEMMT